MKHRIPSPTREAGDGMEATKVTNLNQANSKVVEENVTQQQNVKLIKLPQTNISVEKLPPITDDKVKLPVTEPTSPLVLLSTGQPASKSLQGMYASIAHWSRMKSFCSETISIEMLSKDTSMDLVLCKKSKKSLYFSIIFFRDFYLSALSLFLSKINQILKKS